MEPITKNISPLETVSHTPKTIFENQIGNQESPLKLEISLLLPVPLFLIPLQSHHLNKIHNDHSIRYLHISLVFVTRQNIKILLNITY